MTARIQRIENLAIAITITVAFVVAGYDWWWLPAAFLLFDLSAIGYARSATLGALTYNAVHNYTGPAILASIWLVALAQQQRLWLIGLIAGCWGFHVALDRALGYGLKLSEGFEHTHLGLIGRQRRDSKV